MTRLGTVGTTLSTDDLDKREDLVASAVGTVGTSLSTNCTYGLSDERQDEELLSWTSRQIVRSKRFAQEVVLYCTMRSNLLQTLPR